LIDLPEKLIIEEKKCRQIIRMLFGKQRTYSWKLMTDRSEEENELTDSIGVSADESIQALVASIMDKDLEDRIQKGESFKYSPHFTRKSLRGGVGSDVVRG
jgi:hypothetical protein